MLSATFFVTMKTILITLTPMDNPAPIQKVFHESVLPPTPSSAILVTVMRRDKYTVRFIRNEERQRYKDGNLRSMKRNDHIYGRSHTEQFADGESGASTCTTSPAKKWLWYILGRKLRPQLTTDRGTVQRAIHCSKMFGRVNDPLQTLVNQSIRVAK